MRWIKTFLKTDTNSLKYPNSLSFYFILATLSFGIKISCKSRKISPSLETSRYMFGLGTFAHDITLGVRKKN